MADANQIMGAYAKLLRKNVRLNALAERAWSYSDAHKFADEAADLMFDVLKLYTNGHTDITR